MGYAGALVLGSIDMKICNYCGKAKPLACFRIPHKKRYPNLRAARCSDCVKKAAQAKAYLQGVKPGYLKKQLKYQAGYRERNREKLRKYQRDYMRWRRAAIRAGLLHVIVGKDMKKWPVLRLPSGN
jgi:hypothetical protein